MTYLSYPLLTQLNDKLLKARSKVIIGSNVEGVVDQHHEYDLDDGYCTLMMKSMTKDALKVQ